jgi:tetratricopeptide (TPR) repeat protein
MPFFIALARKIVCLTFSFLYSFSFYAQVIDSLELELKKANTVKEQMRLFNILAREYSSLDLDKAGESALAGIGLAKNAELDRELADLHNTFGVVRIKQGMNDLAIAHLDTAATLYESVGYLQGVSSVLGNLGSLHYLIGKYELALDYDYRCLKIDEELNNTTGIATSLQNIAGIQYIQKDFEGALINSRRGLNLFRELGNKAKMVTGHMVLASVFSEMELLDSASVHITAGLSISQKNGDLEGISEGLSLRAVLHIKQEHYSEALTDINEAIKLIQEIGNPFKLAEAYNTLGAVQMAVKDYDSAVSSYTQQLELAIMLQARHYRRDAIEGLMEVHAKKGDYPKAFEYTLQLIPIKDSILNETNLNKIAELQTIYETQKKEEEIDLLKTQNQLTELELQRQQAVLRARGFMLFASVLILIIILVAWYFARKQTLLKQQKEAAELESKALRAQMNPHFIFNSLNSLQRMYVEGNLDDANDYMSDFAALLRKILDNSNKRSISLNEELSILTLYLELEKVRCSNQISYTIEVDESIDKFSFSVPPLIFQPFVENAIWHGILPKKQPGKILIRINRKGDGISCTIEDDGIGYNPVKKNGHESQGMKITEQRIGESVHIESISSGGTRVSFNLNAVQ